MTGIGKSLMQTLAEKEYEHFLKDYDFRLVLDNDDEYFSCTVFQSNEILLAFIYQMNFGENLMVAELGAPINAAAIAARNGGWSLIGEVWKDAYDEFHKAKRNLPYPHNLTRQQEIILIDHSLRQFMSKVRSKEISISNPAFRMST